MKITGYTILGVLICCYNAVFSEQEVTSNTFQLTQKKETYISLPDPCPPAKDVINNEDCMKVICNTTANCSGKDENCCFNGCVFTCTLTPPVISAVDWLDDIRKIPVTFDVSSDEPEIECSTTSRNNIHLCPSGHVCQIMDRGDPLRGIPNRGVCVDVEHIGTDKFFPYMEDITPYGHELSFADTKKAVYLPGGCFLTTEQYGDIEEFIKGMHFTSCVCSAGSVVCSVPQAKGRKIHK